jgi:hypothetical protein
MKRKHEFFAIRVASKEQVEMYQVRICSCVFVGENASKCVIARRAHEVAAATATLWVRVGKPGRRHSANLLGCERKYH